MNRHLKAEFLRKLDRQFVALLIGLLLSASPAFAQTFVFRVDPAPVMTTNGNVPVGGFPTAYLVPNATIKLCTNSTCTALATAYTDSTGNTSCATSAPVTLPGTNVCTAVAGPQGQFGFWIAPGTYYYTVTTTTGTFGPYPLSSPTLGALGGPGIVSANATGGLVPMTSDLDCTVFAGNSASVKSAACVAALPATGGVLDGSNFQGAQNLNSDAFAGTAKPITYIFGNPGATFTTNAVQNIPANSTIIMRSTIKASGSGAYLFVATGSNVTVDCQGIGVFDGNSTTWGAFSIAGTAGVISKPVIKNCIFKNWNPHAGGAYAVVYVASADYLLAANNTFTNNGGHNITVQSSINPKLEHNNCDTPGYSCINTSGNVGAVVKDNSSVHADMFSYKGGYVISAGLTADVVPTTTSFSVPGTLAMRQMWRPGAAFTVFTSNTASIGSGPTATVQSVTDHTTYLTVVTESAMASAPPQPSSFPVEIFDTGATIADNYSEDADYDDFDYNVVYGTVFRHNICRGGRAGAGHFACVWVGADAQGAVTGFRSVNVTIEDTDAADVIHSGIEVYSTDGLKVNTNSILRANTAGDAGYGGIEICRLGTQRCQDPKMSGNDVHNSKGYGIWNGYSANAVLTGNSIKQEAGFGYGLVLDTNQTTTITGNSVALAAGTSLTTSDTSGTQPNTAIRIFDTWLQSSSGNVLAQMDTGATSQNIAFDATSAIFPTTSIFTCATCNAMYFRRSTPSQIVANQGGTVQTGYQNQLITSNSDNINDLLIRQERFDKSALEVNGTTSGAPTSTFASFTTADGGSIVMRRDGFTTFATGITLATATAQPACVVANRGLFWAVASAAGVKDLVQVCAKDVADAYAWRTIY